MDLCEMGVATRCRKAPAELLLKTICRLVGALALLGFTGGTALAQWSDPESTCASSTTIFCHGFESGSFSIWDDYDGNPAPWNSLQSDPGPLAHAGNTVARLRVPTGSGGTDLVKVLSSSSQRLYARWYQKWEPGYDFAAANHGSGLHAGSRDNLGRSDYRPSGSDWFSALLEPYQGRLNLYVYYRGMYQDCADPNGACWGDRFPCTVDSGASYCTKASDRPRVLAPQLVAGQWYCLEIMMDGGTPTSAETGANGALDFWIDEVEFGPWNNLWMRTSSSVNPGLLWLSLYHHSTHSTEGILLDNVVVSTNRVGCLKDSQKRPVPPSNVQAS